MMNLPANLAANAFRAASGQYAWPRSEVVRVLELAPVHGLAAVAGELWRLSVDDTYMVFIPLRDGSLCYRKWRIEQDWDEEAESWEEFCRRSSAELLARIEEACIEGDVRAEFREKIRYQICLFAMGEYRSDCDR